MSSCGECVKVVSSGRERESVSEQCDCASCGLAAGDHYFCNLRNLRPPNNTQTHTKVSGTTFPCSFWSRNSCWTTFWVMVCRPTALLELFFFLAGLTHSIQFHFPWNAVQGKLVTVYLFWPSYPIFFIYMLFYILCAMDSGWISNGNFHLNTT